MESYIDLTYKEQGCQCQFPLLARKSLQYSTETHILIPFNDGGGVYRRKLPNLTMITCRNNVGCLKFRKSKKTIKKKTLYNILLKLTI